jgi:hypothetical protein
MKALIAILSIVSSYAFQPLDPVKKDKNTPPQANAGEDISITQKDFAQLDGTASKEPDGIISRYQWIQVSGSPVTIENPRAAITAISNASKGEYVFRLSVTDEKGSSSADEVKLVVKD